MPVPLDADVWSRAVFRRPVAADALVTAIATDRKAALLAHGLAALDDETLDYVSREPLLLQALYEEGARRVRRVRREPSRDRQPRRAARWCGGGRPVGGVARPADRSTRRCSSTRCSPGTTAGSLTCTTPSTGLDEARARFLLGLWIPDDHVRVMRFQALGRALGDAYPEWRLEALPFSRPLNDLRAADAAHACPAGRACGPAFGACALGLRARGRGASRRARSRRRLRSRAWTLRGSCRRSTGGDMFWRGERLDQFAFAQRMFEQTQRGRLARRRSRPSAPSVHSGCSC